MYLKVTILAGINVRYFSFCGLAHNYKIILYLLTSTYTHYSSIEH